MRRGAGRSPGILALAWLLVSTPAGAASVEVVFAKGVVAFSRGDFRGAEAHFQQVLEHDANHPQAIYYLGQAAMGLGESERAVGLFRRVLQLRPEQQAVRLDLALALFKLGRYREAEQVLDEVRGALRQRASYQYYLGTCRYRLGRLREALAPLRRAQQSDQGFAAAAGYYLGLALAGVGQQEEAARQFERLASERTRGASARIQTLARDNLASMAQRSRPGRRNWGLFASTGAGFDSNVTLTPSDQSGIRAATVFLAAGGFYRPVHGAHDELRLSAGLYRNFHSAKETRGFDLTDVSAAARYRHRFEAGHHVEMGYRFDLDMLDGGGDAGSMLGMDGFGIYMEGHELAARVGIRAGRRAETSLDYRFGVLSFNPSISERNATTHALGVRQDLVVIGDGLRLAALAGMAYEDGKEVQWNLWGPFAQIEVHVELGDLLGLWATAAYHREDHHESENVWASSRRVDNRWTTSAGAQLQMIDNLSIGLSYRLVHNASLGPFSYDRHLVSLALFAGL